MTKFSLGNYIAGFIGGLPVMVLPILITNSIGAKFSVYFYIDMMIANLLYIIPILFGKYILLAFGKKYSSEGVIFLQILAISGIFLSINYIGNSIFYIKNKIKLIILMSFIGASIILSLSIMLIHQNLSGTGVGWVMG